jgi:phosphate transport system permease protein
LENYQFKKKSKVVEFLGEKIITACAFSAIVVIFLIFIFIFKESLPIFTNHDVRQEATVGKMFLEHDKWRPTSDPPQYSMWPLLIGTIKVTLVAMLIAIPLGIGAAVYSSEFANKRIREWIKPVIELLAGIPSVVLGFFALIVMASVIQNVLGLTFRLNALNAGIALGLAVVPIIFTISEDALNSVPETLREASLALGASPWQVSLTMVIPAAIPGIGAGIVLGFGRAVGETMIVLMASGNAAIISASLTDSIRTFSATIAAELAEVVFGDTHYSVLFFIGSLLFTLTFFINLGGKIILDRLKQNIQGQQ